MKCRRMQKDKPSFAPWSNASKEKAAAVFLFCAPMYPFTKGSFTIASLLLNIIGESLSIERKEGHPRMQLTLQQTRLRVTNMARKVNTAICRRLFKIKLQDSWVLYRNFAWSRLSHPLLLPLIVGLNQEISDIIANQRPTTLIFPVTYLSTQHWPEFLYFSCLWSCAW